MCGIGGFSLKDPSREGARDLAISLALALESRGRHATGMAWQDPSDGGWPYFWKEAGRASRVAWDAPVDQGAPAAIVHTRYATKGSVQEEVNNHPLLQPGLVLVHNGTIQNDEQLWSTMPDADRYGEVDSEVIAALLANHDGHPVDVLSRPRGRMAIAWFTTTDDDLRLARGHGSPLAIAQTEDGDFYFASTLRLLSDALSWHPNVQAKVDWWWDVPEGTYLRVRAGRIVESREFTPTAPVDLDARVIAMTEGGKR